MSDILAIAATTETVHVLIKRLVDDPVLASAVPWSIVNKYYTAEVTIHVHALASWVPAQHQPLAPAILFVWNKGEPYRDHIRTLSQHTSQREFEVALAVRLPPAPSTLPSESEDDQDTDAYLSSEGFEFVDVPDIDVSSSDRTGIPRIVDALSTIMWPSMVRHSSKRGTRAGFLGQGSSSDDYHDLVRLIGEKTSGNDADRLHRELEELERWLDQDTSSLDPDVDGSPWSTAVTPGTLSPSLSGFLELSRPTTPKPGFDDDFTSFVSASSSSSADIPHATLSSPPLTSESFSTTFSFNTPLSGRSTPIFEDHTGFDAARLAPGESYKSLGSVSDFGDQDKETGDVDSLSSGSDQDMPSQAEILETSRKIFGSMPLTLSPTQEQGDKTWPTADGGAPESQMGEQVDVEMKDADLERFDLQSMLDTLQGLKEEISGMPDKERRKAAAKVALCLAYDIGGNPNP